MRTHRDDCPAWTAWDISGACTCDRPILRVPVQCEGCGRFVNVKDLRLTWESERSDYDGELSRWVIGCANCPTPKVPA
jgi:hypothetical protein